VTDTYDWSKLDAGWSYHPNTGRGGTLKNHDGATWLGSVTVNRLEETLDEERCGFEIEAFIQLAKCRIVDTKPASFEQYDDVSKVGEYDPPNPGDVGQGKASEFVAPSQPWRRGPLATWTLVNISNHDGRLTVVMKRGRGELIDETGVDDDSIWERLALKAEAYTRDRMTTQGAT
jgi:hypothetical protein